MTSEPSRLHQGPGAERRREPEDRGDRPGERRPPRRVSQAARSQDAPAVGGVDTKFFAAEAVTKRRDDRRVERIGPVKLGHAQ